MARERHKEGKDSYTGWRCVAREYESLERISVSLEESMCISPYFEVGMLEHLVVMSYEGRKGCGNRE